MTSGQRQHWYTRRGGVVQGPFPRGLVTRYVILGRILPDDELSSDLTTWQPLADLPELVPDIVQQGDDADGRLAAARRWESERRPGERRASAGEHAAAERRTLRDRRSAETGPGRQHRLEDLAQHRDRRRALRLRAGAVAFAVLAVSVAVVLLYQPPPPQAASDCRSAPRAGVNWDNCAMEGRMLARSELTGASMRSMALSRANLEGARLVGADLSYATLSVARLRDAELADARLVGASLRGADLANADLENADLSYADLQGAMLLGARLEGARLDHAIWFDASLCAPGSIGGCLPLEP